MASWESKISSSATTTPHVKFEPSPAESFVSTPGEMYPSLFEADTTDPLETVLTPPSVDEDETALLEDLADGESSTPAPEGSDKKATKKRKSWGQVLPEPKTNLPPRKRAKTEDEKEQRRVERVLRNRRAAQSSRERKRQEVEALEKRNLALEVALREAQQTNLAIMEELRRLQKNSGVNPRSSSPTFHPSPLSLTQPLFGGSSEGDKSAMMDDFVIMDQSNATVNPASLTPELNPVADSNVQSTSSNSTSTLTTAMAAPDADSLASITTTDVAQHPAAVLSSDLQCQSVVVPESWVASRQMPQPALTFFLQCQLLLTLSSEMVSACQRPLTLIAGALKHGLALHPTPSILSTIIWMVTLPSTRNSTSMTSSTTTSQRPSTPKSTLLSRRQTPPASSTTLRIKSLQRLLTCSPNLARPLMDATMEVLRLVSEGREDRVAERLAAAADGSCLGIKGGDSVEADSHLPPEWRDGTGLPSREALLTLLWALRVEERKSRLQSTNTTITTTTLANEGTTSSPMQQPVSRPGLSVPTPINIDNISSKRKRDVTCGGETDGSSAKRSRAWF